MTWNPSQYLAYANQRLRPAFDLIARIPLSDPPTAVDLGCGPGNVTELLRERWPRCAILGIDNDDAMLARARRDYPSASWELGDIAQWKPASSPALIFSNAALHWIDAHEQLFPRLLESLAPGGALAVQMPRNFAAPSHTLLRETINSGPWRTKLERWGRWDRNQPVERYYDALAPRAAMLDIWETEYLHVLNGDDPVLEWTKGSVVTPVREALDAAEWEAFEAEYRARLRTAYPRQPDGRTLFPFRRLFIVATV